MTKELKNYAKRQIWYLIIPWIVVLIVNTVFVILLLNEGCVELSHTILVMTPFIIIIYGLVWWLGTKVGFEQEKVEEA